MCFWFHTVNGCEILHQLKTVVYLSHYFMGFQSSLRLCTILQPSTVWGGVLRLVLYANHGFCHGFFHVFYGVKSCHGGAGCSEQIPQQSETIRLGCQITNLFSGFYIYIYSYIYIYIYPHIVCVLLIGYTSEM